MHNLKVVLKSLLTPIYIFQMGKVGSSSLKSTLSQYLKSEVVHAHSYHGMTTKDQRLLKLRKNLYLPINVICPVREPLSRNISAFFQNFKRDTGSEFSNHKLEVSELLNLFLNNYPHNVCLEWFDRRFRPVFDIDVFAETFPIERKWNIYKKGSIKILIYRSDLDREEQLKVISDFIGTKVIKWRNANISETKNYSQIYREFCESAKLPDIYIDLMNNSSFCKHFWNEKERIENSKRWSGLT